MLDDAMIMFDSDEGFERERQGYKVPLELKDCKDFINMESEESDASRSGSGSDGVRQTWYRVEVMHKSELLAQSNNCGLYPLG